MLVTLLGMVTLVSPEQYSKAETPMLVTLFGIEILAALEQESNASLPMLLTPSAI